MRSCIFVIGTRAQLIKVAPVLRLAAETMLPHVVWLAGQHQDSMEDLMQDFGLVSTVVAPRHPAERASIGQLLAWFPGTLLRCRRYIAATRRRTGMAPLVVVHGDTLSTLIGALAGRLSGARVAHMESGLTSGSLRDPFPEELIRRVVFRLQHFALCPNPDAASLMAGYRPVEVVDTGDNTLLDCVRYAIAARDLPTALEPEGYFLASIHRFENLYRRERLAGIVDELEDLSAWGTVYFVLHPPTVRRLEKFGIRRRLENNPRIRLESRMPYTSFLKLLHAARGVISDGGSNQEELACLGVPTVLWRERSERPDGMGRNVVLRDDIAGSLAGFVAEGGLDRLRQPLRLADAASPSLTTLQAIERWCRVDGETP